jgi:hypothetical protein
MLLVDADYLRYKLTQKYKNATGAARRAYSDALDILCDAEMINTEDQDRIVQNLKLAQYDSDYFDMVGDG